MTQNDIEKAFGERLETADIAPISWPARSFEPNGEYIEFRHAPNNVTDSFISGGGAIRQGLILITAVIPAGNFTTRANEIADLVFALFPKALRMPQASGTALVTDAADFGSGFTEGAYWKQPVVVPYITE